MKKHIFTTRPPNVIFDKSHELTAGDDSQRSVTGGRGRQRLKRKVDESCGWRLPWQSRTKEDGYVANEGLDGDSSTIFNI